MQLRDGPIDQRLKDIAMASVRMPAKHRRHHRPGAEGHCRQASWPGWRMLAPPIPTWADSTPLGARAPPPPPPSQHAQLQRQTLDLLREEAELAKRSLNVIVKNRRHGGR
eukprot:jgi/Mesvir1/28158/Mv04720-RA.1